uniref:Ubiquitin-like protease family profile domain-containing protein n=1 Tax=Oryza rufipogon TaxID=4529 RepID=A0A0E0MXA4_ORYRU
MIPNYEPPARMTKNNIRANKPGTQVCSQVAYWKFIQTLDKDQLQAIDDLGFGGLTKMNGVQIRRILCKQIAREYDEHTGAFNINGTMHEITIEDVDHILGVPSEGVELVEVPQAIQADVDDPKEKEKNEALQATKAALFALYKDKRETKITLSALRDSLNLNKSCDDHFKRQFVLYTIGLILCPTTERFVHSDYLNLLINIADIKRTNWASLTLNHLKRSIVSFQHDKVNLKGNQILLLVAVISIQVMEKFRVSHIHPSIDYTGRDRPLIQYWDVKKARKREKILYGVGQIVNDIKLPIEATKEYTTKDHSGTDANQPSNMDNTKAQTTDMVDVQLQLKTMNEHLIILRKEIQQAKKKKDTSNSPIAKRVQTTGRARTSTKKRGPPPPPPPQYIPKACLAQMLQKFQFTCTEEDEFLIDYINTSPPDRVLIIDTYIMYLEHKYLEESQARRRVYMMKTFITGKISIDCVHEISKRQLEKGYISRITNQIAQNEQIFIPINRNKNHWYLAVVHVKQRQIQLLDSSPSTGKQDTELTLVVGP